MHYIPGVAEKFMRGGKEMKRSMPLPVTVGDCLLVSQMGFEVEVNDGVVKSIKNTNSLSERLKSWMKREKK